MIAFTVFDPSTRKVTNHRWATQPDAVMLMIFKGEAALIGRHVPFDEAVPADGVDFIVTNPDAEEKWTPPAPVEESTR